MATQTFRFLVLGGTGSIGYAFTQELLRHQEPNTSGTEQTEGAKVIGHWPTLQLVEGDAQCGKLLRQSGAEATHIFHGISCCYLYVK